MNYKAILPLVLLVGLLALWVSFLDRPSKGKDESETVAVLWDLDPKKVEKVVFRRAQDLFVAKRVQDRWRVDSIPPESEALVESLIENVCETLSRVPLLMEMEETSPVLDRYGLQVPEMEVEMYLVQEREPRRLFFGNPNARNTARYARTGEDRNKVVLLGSLVYWEISESLQTMKRLMSVKEDSAGTETGLSKLGREAP